MKVLMIVASRLHLGYLGCYGNDWIETPHLDQFATQAAVFDQHYSNHPNSAGLGDTIRTGRYAFPPIASQSPQKTSIDGDFLHELRSKDIPSALIHDESQFGPAAFREGWNQVESIADSDRSHQTRRSKLRSFLKHSATLEHWFVWVELSMLIPPWQVPEELQVRYMTEPEDENEELMTFVSAPCEGFLDEPEDANFIRLQRSYGAAVTHLDKGIGLLLDEIAKCDTSDAIVTIVTTDSGMVLGEHGIVGDAQPWLYEERVHIPLIARIPGPLEAGQRIHRLTQSIDLHATLLDLFAMDPSHSQGKSLLPLLRGDSMPLHEYVCSGCQLGSQVEFSLRTASRAYILPKSAGEDSNRKPQLYIKPDDRWEVNDVAQHHGEQVEQFEKTLIAFVEASRRDHRFIPPTLESNVVKAPGELVSAQDSLDVVRKLES